VVSAGLVYLAASSVSAGCWVGVRWRVAQAESPSAYEKKGELDKALADFREALNNGNTAASEDINRNRAGNQVVTL